MDALQLGGGRHGTGKVAEACEHLTEPEVRGSDVGGDAVEELEADADLCGGVDTGSRSALLRIAEHAAQIPGGLHVVLGVVGAEKVRGESGE